MSTSEYNDLFLTSQTKGMYHMFIFDIVNSKKMDNTTRKIASKKMIQLMLKIYNTIKEIEKQTNKKILVIEDGIVPYGEFLNMKKAFGILMEPFIFGDTFGFTIYKNSLKKKEIINIYEYYKKELEIDFDFHKIDGYYETNKWEEGNILFFRGYCIDILSNYHKDYNQIVKQKKIN